MSVAETSGRRRLFFAVWPPAAVRERIATLARHLPLKTGSPVRPDNFHITLQFLGQVTETQEQALVAGAGAVVVSPFELCLDQLGYWPRPRVAWLGLAKKPPELLALAEALGQVMVTAGLQPDPRPYHPHLTLRRKVRPQSFEAEIRPICWRVDHFVLVHSRTFAEGVDYQVIEDFPGRGGDD